jgi:Putative Actinobacterial Holin-X, holin superfamily III
MLAPSANLLRAGLALKLDQVKRATRSYLRDRTQQATDSATSYVLAAGLFAAAGIFLIAACLVGIMALFRWIEIKYGLFQAFGAIGALLVIISAIFAGIAAARLKRRPREFPSLASRLRVAVKANPLKLNQTDTDIAKDAAAEVLTASPAPPRRPGFSPRGGRNGRNMQIGLVVMAALLGAAAARRRQTSRRMQN